MGIRSLVAPTLQFQTGNLRQRLSRPGVDFSAYGSAIQYCSDHRLLRQGRQLHARLILLSVKPDNFLASKLILLYSKSDHAHEARKVFDATPRRNTFTWNAMLLGYSFNAMFRDALNLFVSFTSSSNANASPDNFTISCILKTIPSSFCSPNLAKEVHCFVLRRRFDSDIFILNALITCYCRCDEVWLARKVFDGMSNRDTVTWNAMIGGYSQRMYYDECKRLYMEMLAASGVAPNVVTAMSMMQACGQSMDQYHSVSITLSEWSWPGVGCKTNDKCTGRSVASDKYRSLRGDLRNT